MLTLSHNDIKLVKVAVAIALGTLPWSSRPRFEIAVTRGGPWQGCRESHNDHDELVRVTARREGQRERFSNGMAASPPAVPEVTLLLK